MNSTSLSKEGAAPVLAIQDLDIVYNINFYRHSSVREKFIEFFSNPIKTIFGREDQLHVIKKLNLNLYKGDRLGILGVNGSGKTSLCRCIADMIRPRAGSIKRQGEIRSIFDTSVGIFPQLTGRENTHLLARFMYPHLTDIKDIKTLVEETLAHSEIGAFVDVPLKKYSRGMKTRICLSLVSALPCEMLLLDEIFDGADEFFQKKISERMLHTIEKSGTVIFISHSPAQLKLTCNKTIVLHDGRIAFEGDVQEGIDYYHREIPKMAKTGHFISI